MTLRFKLQHLVLVLALALASCGQFEKVRKSTDVNFKLTKANEYFDKKDWAHANELYKELLPIMKSTRNFEALFYRYSYTFYNMKDYVEASYYFKNFTEYFPTSKETEECEYMSAVCLFKFAPKYSLDPTNTIKALEALQSYINRHPQSARVAEAGTFIDACRKKLEQKESDGARLYYNIGQFKAAAVAFRSVMRDYPESPNDDLYQYMIVKSMFRYAKQSIPEKQEERFAATITAFRELKDNFPKSQYLADAEKIVNDATNYVKKIRDEHK